MRPLADTRRVTSVGLGVAGRAGWVGGPGTALWLAVAGWNRWAGTAMLMAWCGRWVL